MTVLFIGCSDSNSNPAKVAEKFTKAYYKGDFDTCNSLLEKEKFTPSKDMSEMEKEAFKEMKKNLDEMKYVITPDNEDNVVEEDYYETTFIITSKKTLTSRTNLMLVLKKETITNGVSPTLILIDRLFNFCINHHLPTTYEKKKHHHPVIDNIVNMCT